MRSATPSPYVTGITPWLDSHSWCGSLARPITVAPAFLASCTAIVPTPPAAPETTTVSPWPTETARTIAYAVAPATYSDPAASHDTPAGLGTRCSASASTSSACAGSVVRPPEDLVADGEPGDALAPLFHDAREVTALTGRERGRPQLGQGPRPDFGLARVDRRGLDPDQHLPGAGDRAFHVDHLQDVYPAVLIEPDSLRHPQLLSTAHRSSGNCRTAPFYARAGCDDVHVSDAPQVTDNQAESRFELDTDGHVAVLMYRRNGKRLVLIHTDVPG